MSLITANQVIALIEDSGGPWHVDLSGKDLYGIDFSTPEIQRRAQDFREANGIEPTWWLLHLEKGGGINLHGINLEGASLSKANLEWANFDSANLKGANLSNANLRHSCLSNATLEGALFASADLQGASLHNSDLRRAVFHNSNLQDARLYRANMRRAYLRYANLTRASLVQADLELVDLRYVASLQHIYLSEARFDRTMIDRTTVTQGIGEENDKQWIEARRVYSDLKVNWRNQGDYIAARWAWIRECNMARKAQQNRLRLEKCRDLFRFQGIKNIGQLAWSWLWWLSSNYAEEPLRVFLWILLFAFGFFPLLYWLFDAVVPVDSTQMVQYWDYVRFSLRSTVTLAYSSLEPSRIAGDILVFFQGALGVGGFALFIYTLSRRMVGY